MSGTPELAVVIPAYNEAERLPRTLQRVLTYLKARGGAHEVIVVDDGSRDGTAEKAREAGGPGVTVVSNDGNRGKGYSVRRGMLLARGARRLMTDADLSTPIEDVEKLLASMDGGHDVVIASRRAAGANVEVHQPLFRELSGQVFNLCVQLLIVPGLKDTQCGFKLFTAQAAQDVFGAALLDGFSFDVEALFLARKRGYRIAEVPVTWRNDAATRVRTSQGILAFLDLARIRISALQGRYRR